MTDPEMFARNRVILCHFDGYSTALVFARFGNTLLAPEAPPEGSTITSAPADMAEVYAGNAVLQASIAHYRLKPADVLRDNVYDAWLQAERGPLIRVHLLRFQTFLAPAAVLESHGGVFFPISALRAASRVELELIRGVFNLIVGGDQSRG